MLRWRGPSAGCLITRTTANGLQKEEAERLRLFAKAFRAVDGEGSRIIPAGSIRRYKRRDWQHGPDGQVRHTTSGLIYGDIYEAETQKGLRFYVNDDDGRRIRPRDLDSVDHEIFRAMPGPLALNVSRRVGYLALRNRPGANTTINLRWRKGESIPLGDLLEGKVKEPLSLWP